MDNLRPDSDDGKEISVDHQSSFAPPGYGQITLVA